jgi:hypothetical protein
MCGQPITGTRKTCSNACRQKKYRRNRACNVTALQSEALSEIQRKLDQLLEHLSQAPVEGPKALARPFKAVPALGLETLEVVQAKGNNQSGRILTLQVWLTANTQNVRLFNERDLDLVLGHPAFNQALIQGEINRRKKQVTPVPPPAPASNGKRLPGAEVVFAAPHLDDLELL